MGINIDKILDGYTLDNKGFAIGGNGQAFTVERKGMMPTLVDELYSERVVIKKQMIARLRVCFFTIKLNLLFREL